LLLIDLRAFLACPARFELATYALEAVKMRLNNTKNNSFKVFTFGVGCPSRNLVLGGIGWIRHGIGRRSNVEILNLSGKPTN
jgi:hypothetical protein